MEYYQRILSLILIFLEIKYLIKLIFTISYKSDLITTCNAFSLFLLVILIDKLLLWINLLNSLTLAYVLEKQSLIKLSKFISYIYNKILLNNYFPNNIKWVNLLMAYRSFCITSYNNYYF